MQITVDVPFSFDLFVALKQDVPPEGVTMHVPPMKGQRDYMSMIVWDPITIDVGTSLAIPLFVNWLYDRFKDASRPPQITIRRRQVEWDKGALTRAIEEEITIEKYKV